MVCSVAGIGVIGLGASVTIVGLVWLILVSSRVDKQSLVRARDFAEAAKGKGPGEDMAKLIEAINKTIELVGAVRGVALMVMVLGIFLVIVGAGIAGLSG